MVACAPDRKMARNLPRSGLVAALVAGVALVVTPSARTLPDGAGRWVAILPPGWWLVAAPVAAIAVAFAWARFATSMPRLARWPAAAWSALALTLLPWLSPPLPAAVLLWTGPLAWLVWIGAVVAGGAACTIAIPWRPSWLADRRWGGLAAGAAALVLFTGSFAAVHRILPGGDEPHYLVIAESLRRDRDLAIDDNHTRGDYLAFFGGELTPDYLRRGVDRRIYSIHAPGLPALLLPAYALFGYPGAVAAMLLLSACGALVLWRLVLDLTADAGAAWFAWAATAGAAPILFHTFTIFPDGVAGLAALLAVRALVGAAGRGLTVREALLAGAALALLPWLHTRAVLIAGVFGPAILAAAWWRGAGWRTLAALVSAPAVSLAGWFGYFVAIYGIANPSAPYGGYTQTATAHIPAGVAGLLFDAQFGLLCVAPVFALAVVGVTNLVGRSPGVSPGNARATPREALETGRVVGGAMLAAFVATLVAAACYRMWWGGASAPARFLVPMLWPLGVAIGVAWSRATGLATRALAIAALVVTLAVSAVLVGADGGRLAYGSRDAVPGWTRWASPVVDLARAVPGVHRTTPGRATAVAAVWLGAAALAWLVIVAIERRGGAGARAQAAALSGLVIGVAATGAAGVAWRVDGATDPRLPGGAEAWALRRWQAMPGATLVAAGAGTPRRTRADGVQAHVVLTARPVGSGRQARLELPAVPPGRYWLTHVSPLPAAFALRVGRSGLDWRRLEPSPAPAPLELSIPVAIPPSTAWPLDASATATLGLPRTLTLEPIAPQPSTAADAVARQVVRYGARDVFFLDEWSYPEPPGFWVRPGGSRVVVGEGSGALVLALRNAGVDNTVTLSTPGWSQTLTLAPGEEQRIEIPGAAGATALTIDAARGFRPFDGDAKNRDFRRLGVFVFLP
jgi:hypothetical protein